MIDDFIEQLKKATNVYRTEQHIVVQSFGVQFNKTYGSVTVSYDTYYPRTEELDDLFEEIYSERRRIDGKRLHSTMYVRKYVYY